MFARHARYITSPASDRRAQTKCGVIMLDFDEDDRAYVYAVAHRILKIPDLASDATQDALLRAYRHRAQYRGDAAPRTWLHRLAVTTQPGHLRARQRSP